MRKRDQHSWSLEHLRTFPTRGNRLWAAPRLRLSSAATAFLAFLAAALEDPTEAGSAAPPYPASPVVLGLQWHETLNFGTNCDNWPTTWADDDRVYTAAGDGHGFGGSILGSWVCRLTGSPPSISGENRYLVSEGDGPDNSKVCSLLSIGGTLYAWLRNVEPGQHSRLGWSTDHGLSWTWGPTFTLLGYPAFVQFGKDYAGARDSYVYTVCHDNPSAYVPSDHFILMRVPITSITNMQAWQYFAGTNGGGHPIWSSLPGMRAAIFSHVNEGAPRCQRSQMSYIAGLGRYLWWQMYPTDLDEKLEGGFSVYDAPQPWGPWTTVYFTTDWDQPPGETGNFCTKYASADGRTLYLVHSAWDHCSIRRATVTTSTLAVPAVASALSSVRTFPNPFSSATRTEFLLRAPSVVVAEVRDVHGRKVVTLSERVLAAGVHSIDWSGRDALGRDVASGVYWLRIDAGGEVEADRVVRLR